MKFFKLKPTPESAIIYMKTIVFLLFSWPLNKDASKLTKIITKLSWWICFFISLFLIIPLCYGAYIQRNDLLAATKSICLAVVCAQYVVKLFICKSQNKRVQVNFNLLFYSHILLRIEIYNFYFLDTDS